MRTVLPSTLCILSLLPTPGQAQATRSWITETTVTWGRGGHVYQGFGTDAVAVADLGLRWSYPSGVGWGLSFAGGYDFPNESALLGGRVRTAREWDHGRLEGSAAVLVSSIEDWRLGGSVGLAYYPRPWGAAVLQLDFIPTHISEQAIFEEFGEWRYVRPTRDPAVSVGARIGERVGALSWVGAAAVGALALIFSAAWDGIGFGPVCC